MPTTTTIKVEASLSNIGSVEIRPHKTSQQKVINKSTTAIYYILHLGFPLLLCNLYLSLMLPHIVSALDILNVSSPTSQPSMLSNCSVNPQGQDNEDGIKLLQVPVWDDKIKTELILPSINHDTSLTWSDSLLDGASDHSEPLASFRDSFPGKYINNDDQQQQQQPQRRRRRLNKEQLKRRHQIQADILVEKRYIGQLRQSEDYYTQMRTHYENQIQSLQNQLIDMRCQRDHALGDIESNERKRKKNSNNKNDSSATNNSNSNSAKPNAKVTHGQQQHPHYHVTRHVKQHHATTTTKLSPPSLSHKQMAQQIKEIKLHYQGKIQRLTSKSQELERKYAQVTHTMATARTHAEQVVRTLHSKMNQLQTERKRLEQAMKHDNARLRNQLSLANQEIQQMKTRDTIPVTPRKKAHPHQNITVIKKDTKNYQYIQQINSILRKAAADGALLSTTFTLEKIQVETTTMPATTTLCLQHSPPPSPMGLN